MAESRGVVVTIIWPTYAQYITPSELPIHVVVAEDYAETSGIALENLHFRFRSGRDIAEDDTCDSLQIVHECELVAYDALTQPASRSANMTDAHGSRKLTIRFEWEANEWTKRMRTVRTLHYALEAWKDAHPECGLDLEHMYLLLHDTEHHVWQLETANSLGFGNEFQIDVYNSPKQTSPIVKMHIKIDEPLETQVPDPAAESAIMDDDIDEESDWDEEFDSSVLNFDRVSQSLEGWTRSSGS